MICELHTMYDCRYMAAWYVFDCWAHLYILHNSEVAASRHLPVQIDF
jgi:hypothetical protein